MNEFANCLPIDFDKRWKALEHQARLLYASIGSPILEKEGYGYASNWTAAVECMTDLKVQNVSPAIMSKRTHFERKAKRLRLLILLMNLLRDE